MVRLAEATALVRDLVNTGASDLGPGEIEAQVETLAKKHGGTLAVTRGDSLATGYPMIHAVGQAAARDPGAPPGRTGMGATQTIPGLRSSARGVVFDSGGLNIKPGAGMRLMKKDMGGRRPCAGAGQPRHGGASARFVSIC